MKALIVFDLDGTLAASKQVITTEMADLFGKLLGRCQVAVISGGEFERFQTQLLGQLKVEPVELEKLHLMPTNGTRYWRFDPATQTWARVYQEDLPSADRERITQVLTEGAKSLGILEGQPYGEIIGDRGTQVTFSGLGQRAPLEAKLKWDPDRKKRQALRDLVSPRLEGFEVLVAGTTSIDVVKKGIDKAYGVRKLQEILGVNANDVLFIGDALELGGNDHPVKAMGIETIAVKDQRETAQVIKDILQPRG